MTGNPARTSAHQRSAKAIGEHKVRDRCPPAHPGGDLGLPLTLPLALERVQRSGGKAQRPAAVFGLRLDQLGHAAETLKRGAHR